MAVGVKCGSFTKSGTSNTITTTFKVKALIVYNTTVGATAVGTYQGSGGIQIGISDGTTNFVSAVTSTDGATTSACFQTWNTYVAVTHSVPGTQQDTGVATFGATTDFTITWTNGGTPQTPTFNYIAIGGDDITNAKVLNFTVNRTTTGSQGYTGVGFQPDFGFVLAPFKTALGNNLTYANSGFSAFSATDRRWAIAYLDENGATTQDSWRVMKFSHCHAKLSNAGGDAGTADFVSWDVDGFTWNWTTTPNGSTQQHAGLFIKGGKWDVDIVPKPTTTGAQTQNVTINDNTLMPKLVMLASTESTGTLITNQMSNISFGASDGTDDGAVWMGAGPDASDPMINASIKLNDKVLRIAAANTVHTSSTTTAECSIATGGSMSTAGQFTLNWTTNANTLASTICWIALGSSAAGGAAIEKTISESAIPISDSGTVTRSKSRTRAETITVTG